MDGLLKRDPQARHCASGLPVFLLASTRMSAPFFSLIIPCRNAAAAIGATLDSVLTQVGTDLEVLVIDGASGDGTADVVRAHGHDPVRLWSEPDRGVYDAMNKGIRLSRGHWLLFLGADDRLAGADMLARVRAAIGPATGGVFCGEAQYTDGRVYQLADRPWLAARNFVHHQAAFYHRSCFAGREYDLSLPIQSDYDLNLCLWRAGMRFVPLAVRVAVCGPGGLSDGGSWANYRDEIRVRHRHFPAWRCWPWDLGSVVRCLRKKTVLGLSRRQPSARRG